MTLPLRCIISAYETLSVTQILRQQKVFLTFRRRFLTTQIILLPPSPFDHENFSVTHFAVSVIYFACICTPESSHPFATTTTHSPTRVSRAPYSFSSSIQSNKLLSPRKTRDRTSRVGLNGELSRLWLFSMCGAPYPLRRIECLISCTFLAFFTLCGASKIEETFCCLCESRRIQVTVLARNSWVDLCVRLCMRCLSCGTAERFMGWKRFFGRRGEVLVVLRRANIH